MHLCTHSCGVAAIDVPKAVQFAARFLAQLLEDKMMPEAILDALPALCGPGLHDPPLP